MDFDAAGELDGILKGFTSVGMGRNGSLGYFNAKADLDIDTRSSKCKPPSTKQRMFHQSEQNNVHIPAPMRGIDHHQMPTSAPLLSLLPPAHGTEGVGSGVATFQTTVSDESLEGKAVERFVMKSREVQVRSLLSFFIGCVRLDHGYRRRSDRCPECQVHNLMLSLSLAEILESGPRPFTQNCSINSAPCSILRTNYKTTVSCPDPGQSIVCTVTQPTIENRDPLIPFL